MPLGLIYDDIGSFQKYDISKIASNRLNDII